MSRTLSDINRPERHLVSKLTLPELERHLWATVDILRGSVNSADYKHYILSLLFYKRLCDVWEETDKSISEENPLILPARYTWSNMMKVSKRIGYWLNRALKAIESENPLLKGVFQEIDFSNPQRFPDEMLTRLLLHFDRVKMGNSNVMPTILGDAYEYLLARFAADAGKKGGEFYTPGQVVKLMVRLLAPEEGMTIYDPTCGAGGMLLESVRYMMRQGLKADGVTLYGQEKNLTTWAICKMSLFLRGINKIFVESGDTLLNPKHFSSTSVLKKFDRVIANPPFSLKKWGHPQWSEGDPYDRDVYGCPPRTYGDLAFVQHMIASLNDKGRMAVVVPHGVLFRSNAEARIRKGIIEADLIEAVVGVGPNLFYGTSIPAAILLLNKDKPRQRKGKIIIVNGAKEIVEGKNQNTLSEVHINKLVGAVRMYTDRELFCRVVSIGEIRENDYNLNLVRYVQTTPPPPPVNVAHEFLKLQKIVLQRNQAEYRMNQLLEEFGFAMGEG